MSGLGQDAAVHQKKENHIAELAQAKAHLEEWKAKVEKADDSKSGLILMKLEQEREKKNAQNLLKDLMQRQEEDQTEGGASGRALRAQLSLLSQKKKDLMDNLKRSRFQLQQRRADAHKLQNKFKICADLPDAEVEFIKPKRDSDDVTGEGPIRSRFSVCQQGALLLQGGQALITFEEEKVVSQVLQMDRCSVSFDDQTLEVKPKRIRTEPVVQFEIHLSVSRSHLDVSEVMSAMPKERLEERLALAFSRPSRGGAEVQSVQFSAEQRKARIHFLSPGVAESLFLRGEHSVDLEFPTKVKVSPVYEHQLHKFQSFCGALKRTLLLDDILDTGDEEEVQDQLEIHFQKPSNGGGEIEHTKYLSPGKSLLAFLCPDH
ncbi:N-myc-interactor [Eucyclogobius newberryi]|uniref:N-myc-interactor n=1 Tax=Eucyclogobius newberryi TaxID=166745 RepID=UPI003B5A0F67